MVQESSGGNDHGNVDEAEEQFCDGTQLVTVGRYLEAIQAFNKALEIRPREVRYLAGLAAAVDRLGFFQHALSLAGQATDAAPLSPDAWFLHGLALYRLGNYTGAAESLGRAVALLPDHAEALFFKGNCHFLSGEVDASIDCFDRLLRISGRYPKALYNKGVSLAALGRFDEAVDAY